MKKVCLIITLLAAFSLTVNAQKKAIESINQNDLKSYMTFFASNEMAGRETGTIQNDAAALYIKTTLMRLGLKPIQGEDQYFQMIPFVMTKTDKENSFLKIYDSNGENIFTTDSLITIMKPSINVEYTGNLVFAGYGYADKEKGYNDLSGFDLKNKIVLVMTGKPDNKAPVDSEFFDETTEGPKMISIIGGGAKAVLLVYDPVNKFKDAYASGLAQIVPEKSVTLRTQMQSSPPAQISFITQKTADEILKPAGVSLMQLRNRIISSGKPASMEIYGTSAKLKSTIQKIEFSGPNVTGIIEGTDPVLKNECIIYTAHFDHVGINETGEIYNGADDNASGSMSLLEIAEAFMKLRKKPQRTVVFVWMNGEEKGLLGSNYYVQNPLFPLDKTVININLDMVGRSRMAADTGKLYGFDLNITHPREVIVYTAHESSELTDIMNNSAREAGITVRDMGKDIPFGSSDHAPFRDKGIPALCFHSGVHRDLHSPGDDVEKIDFDKMERSSKLAFLIGYKVANQKKRIEIDNPLK